MQQRDRQDMIIQSGRLDYYIPLKYETASNFGNLGKKILKRILDTIDQSTEQELEIIQVLQKRLKQEPQIEKNKTGFMETAWKKIKHSEEEKFMPHLSMEDDITLILGGTESGLTIQIMKEEWAAFNQRCAELRRETKQNAQLGGAKFEDYHQRFVLPPLRVQLYNKEYVWLNAILYLFNNLMGIIKLELPLKNVSTFPLKAYCPSSYIATIEDKWGFLNEKTDCDFVALGNQYIDYFLTDCAKTITVQTGVFYNTILFEFDGKPRQVDNIKTEVQEELYRIIAAPVTNIGCAPYRRLARHYLDQHFWGEHSIRYFLSTTGGCLSIIDQETTDWIREYYRQDKNKDEAYEEKSQYVENVIIQNMCTNVEYAIIILLLKKINSTYVYNRKQSQSRHNDRMQREYNSNVMYIAEIQERCMGTVSELVEKFGELMPYYIKEKLVSEKMQALDEINTDEKQRRETGFQTFLSAAGVVGALVFGLPAIEETLGILRMVCPFVKRDFQRLTVENVSCGIWIAMIFIVVCLFIRYMTKTYNWKICRWNKRIKKNSTKIM